MENDLQIKVSKIGKHSFCFLNIWKNPYYTQLLFDNKKKIKN